MSINRKTDTVVTAMRFNREVKVRTRNEKKKKNTRVAFLFSSRSSDFRYFGAVDFDFRVIGRSKSRYFYRTIIK